MNGILRFDPVISLGTLVQIVILVTTIVVAYFKFQRKVDQHFNVLEKKIEGVGFKVGLMWTVFKSRFKVSIEEEKEEE